MSSPTHTLTLLRHAKSSWGYTNLTDKQRPLNERGENDAPEMGRRMKERSIRPSLIICSSAVRTWQTARLVADAIGFPVEFIHKEPKLYLASASQIMQVVCAQDPSFLNILVVGHNPGISDLASQLTDDRIDNMPTAASLTLSAQVSEWSSFALGDPDIVAYDYPKKVE